MPVITHSWDLTPPEAAALQKELAAQVSRENKLGPVRAVAGIDASYRNGLEPSQKRGFLVKQCALAYL